MKWEENFKKLLTVTACMVVFFQGLLVVNATEIIPDTAKLMGASSISGNVVEPSVSGNIPNIPIVAFHNEKGDVIKEANVGDTVYVSWNTLKAGGHFSWNINGDFIDNYIDCDPIQDGRIEYENVNMAFWYFEEPSWGVWPQEIRKLVIPMDLPEDTLLFGKMDKDGWEQLPPFEDSEAYRNLIDNVKRYTVELFVHGVKNVSKEDTINNALNKSESNSNSSSTAEIITNAVTDSGGKPITSSVGGIYIAEGVNGTAIVTPKENISSAIGLTNTETNVGFYVCDNYKYAENEPLRNAIASSSKSLVSYLNVDMYTITKQGLVSVVRSTPTPVTIMFGIPSSFQNEGRNFSVICIDENGQIVEFEDMDSDNKTITINATAFGKYAVVYEDS